MPSQELWGCPFIWAQKPVPAAHTPGIGPWQLDATGQTLHTGLELERASRYFSLLPSSSFPQTDHPNPSYSYPPYPPLYPELVGAHRWNLD